MVLSALATAFPGPTFRRQARKALQEVRAAEQIEEILKSTVEFQKARKKTRPRHGFGVNFIIRYAEWSCAFYQALTAHGFGHEEAGDLVEDVNWRAFQASFRLLFKVSRLRSSDPIKRVQWISDRMFQVLFTKPFRYQWRKDRNGVAFDIHHCPLAEYIQDQGYPNLIPYAACNLDYRMAKEWGVSLNRSQTIATGSELCDFQFHLPQNGENQAVDV